MKIAVFHNVPAGGAKRAIREMSKGLAARGHALIEVAPTTAELERYSLAPYAQRKTFALDWPQWRRRIPFVTPYLHLAAGMLGMMRYHRLSRAMARWIEAQKVDALFANDCSILLNPPVVGYARVPSLLYIHHGSHLSCEAISHEAERTPPVAARLKQAYYSPASSAWNTLRYGSERWAARRARALACNSQLAQRLIGKAYQKHSRVIHIGVNGQQFTPAAHAERGDYVMSAGAITAHKDFRFLVQSLAAIPPALRPSLLIASAHAEADELARLTDLATELQVNLRVVHPRSDEALCRLYSEARAFIFSARHEAFGLVVLEALACATPVIVVEDGGYVDCIVQGMNGFVTPRCPQAFAEAITHVLGDPTLRERMCCCAREHVLTHWNWTRTVDELEQELRTLAG